MERLWSLQASARDTEDLSVREDFNLVIWGIEDMVQGNSQLHYPEWCTQVTCGSQLSQLPGATESDTGNSTPNRSIDGFQYYSSYSQVD